jgi:hypothetical protein
LWQKLFKGEFTLEEVMRVCREICSLIDPELVILHGKKVSVSTEKIKSFDLCIIVNTVDKLETEKQIYLNVEASVPYNVMIYTPEEWQKHSQDEESHAHFILKKGTVIYDKR